MASLQMDVVEIRRTVYGKAMREPIADACEKVRRKGSADGILFNELQDKFSTRIRMIRTNPLETWYTYDYEITPTLIGGTTEDFDMVSTRAEITAALISGDEYLLSDVKAEDGIELISDNDYCWTLINPVIDSHICFGDDYELVLAQALFE